MHLQKDEALVSIQGKSCASSKFLPVALTIGAPPLQRILETETPHRTESSHSHQLLSFLGIQNHYQAKI